MELAKLRKIDLRSVWQHEALDFTKWLSLEENLGMLSNEIGVEMSLIQTEASVGKYSVDILAEEENTGRKIVIENQLETTDHDHLGKLITYASGFDAEIVIWIVKDVRDEHKQAIDWLNEHSDEHANFFVIKMEVWQIGDSPYAPKFQVISQPNDWAKAVKNSPIKSELTSTRLMQLEFWTDFRNYGEKKTEKLRFRKPLPRSVYDISIGNSKAHLILVCDTKTNRLRCGFYISDDKELFRNLEAYKTEIENELNYDLQWYSPEERKASIIYATRDADISITEKWEEYFDWLISTAEDFQRVFLKYLKKVV